MLCSDESKTVICDIDGTLVYHVVPTVSSRSDFEPELLPGTLEKLLSWERSGHRVILMTGRHESAREVTEKQLARLGVSYDHLIMGVGRGTRILINDRKLDGSVTAVAFCPDRNVGIGGIDV